MLTPKYRKHHWVDGNRTGWGGEGFETSFRTWQELDVKKHLLPTNCASLRSSEAPKVVVTDRLGWAGLARAGVLVAAGPGELRPASFSFPAPALSAKAATGAAFPRQ